MVKNTEAEQIRELSRNLKRDYVRSVGYYAGECFCFGVGVLTGAKSIGDLSCGRVQTAGFEMLGAVGCALAYELFIRTQYEQVKNQIKRKRNLLEIKLEESAKS
jgi:hypothetical protein